MPHLADIQWPPLLALLGWVILISYFFAKVEIHIEGRHGWAAQLPTWRIEKHWLLDVFWGGRPLTGYHAWVFPFILLFSHRHLNLGNKVQIDSRVPHFMGFSIA